MNRVDLGPPRLEIPKRSDLLFPRVQQNQWKNQRKQLGITHNQPWPKQEQFGDQSGASMLISRFINANRSKPSSGINRGTMIFTCIEDALYWYILSSVFSDGFMLIAQSALEKLLYRQSKSLVMACIESISIILMKSLSIRHCPAIYCQALFQKMTI